MISVHLFFMSLSSFAGSLLAPLIVKKLGKKPTFIFSTSINGIVYIILRLTGGRDPAIFIALVSLGALLGASGMSIGPALYSDTVEYGRWKTGKDGRAFIMSMFSMPVKIGVALSGAVVGYGLALIGYDPTSEVTAELVNGIVNLTTLIPIICSIVSALLFALFYKLTDEKVVELIKLNEEN